MRSLPAIAGCIAAIVIVSCQTNRPVEQQESEPVESLVWTRVNKFHCSGSMSNLAAPARVQLPRNLAGAVRSVVLQDADPLRHGTSSFDPQHPNLRLPESAFLLTLVLSDRPPIRHDATSVVDVTEPSFCFIYSPGTQIVIMDGYFSPNGKLLDMMPIQLRTYTIMDRRPAWKAPTDARKIIGLLEEAKLQSFMSSL